MIKIVHFTTGLLTGGAEMMLYKLVSRMNRNYFYNIVVSLTDKGTLGSRIEALDIPVYTLGMKHNLTNPFSSLGLIRILKKERPQVLQTWLYHADLFGLLAGRLSRVPSIVWNLRCSSLNKGDISPFTLNIIRLLAKLSHMPNAVIVNSFDGKLAHESLGYKPVKWEVIPNGFDTEAFCPSQNARMVLRKELGLSEHTPLIGLVARFTPMKDHLNFLNAAGRLHEVKPDVHFVLVGQGVIKENTFFSEQINLLDINNQTHLLGERDDIPAITAGLDIATSSSYGEGFPNVIGEAMACGVPCVVTDVGDSAYLVGETGLVVPARKPSALTNAWVKILSMSENSRHTLGNAARERVISLFSIDSIVKKYEKLYSNILSK